MTAIALITCSGLSNVGRLTTAVAQHMLMRQLGGSEWVRAQAGPVAIAEAAVDADLVIVLDGCEDCCGSTKVIEAGVEASIQLMATELGVVKDGRAEVTYKEIETVARAMLAAIEAAG